MYSITEIILIQLLFFIIVLKSNIAINYLRRYLPFFYENLNEFIQFYNFVCENNPLLLNLDKIDNTLKIEDVDTNKNSEIIKNEEKFEDKYLKKFKTFPNEFIFDETELNQEIDARDKIKNEFEKSRADSIQEINQKLSKIEEIIINGGFREKIDNENGQYTSSMNSDGIKLLLDYFDIFDEYESNDFDICFEDLYADLLSEKYKLSNKMLELENTTMTNDEVHSKARETIINKKLDKFIDNYILEYTPLGNIYMRYNNDKKSFEYFSNNSIPYRYLEPVGRKYVMTYWCKPIFVDIEEELKKAEEIYDKKKEEEENKRQEEERIKKEDKNINPKKVLVKLKNYNKDTKEQNLRPMKNRSDKNAVLPPQIKGKLPDVNKTSEKQLLKEKANRYTWEGRLTNFNPLKKIDKKVLDKKLNMTYSEFKKLQQQTQNKKYV